jgi:predicted secreted protein
MFDELKRLSNRFLRRQDLCDGRSRKVILLPHCALNQNSRVAGAAVQPAAMIDLVMGLLEREIGLLQMPCPELSAFGLNRAKVVVEREMRTEAGRELSRRLARDLVRQVRTYLECKIHVIGVLGKNGSPSCGVEETWDGGVCKGSGAFIEEIAAELSKHRIALEMTGIHDNESFRAISAVDRWLSTLAHP